MKKFFFWFVLLLIIVSGFIFIYSEDKRSGLVSPLLNIKQSFADNVWFPNSDANQNFDDLNISSQAAFFVETSTGQVLYEKNAHQRLSPASLTKIMTVIITLENRSFDDVLKVSDRAAGMEPDKMLLIAGETLTVKELLEGVFLISANDAAEVLAEQAVRAREEFINLMNVKAGQIGMKNTYFINPTGLEEDGQKQYSTAYDITLMTRYATTKWPQLISISSQPHIFISATDKHQDYDLYSGINLLTTYPGVIGFKTGYTPEAGLTLVTIARRGNKEVLGVILGSTARREDARTLLDYSFKKLGV